MKNLLGVEGLSPEEVSALVEFGIEVKAHPEKYRNALERKTLAMLFQKTSTRTRVSFEASMTQLGGHGQYLDWRTTNFTLGDLKDEVRCIARYADIIMARVYEHEDIEAMAEASRVPVINGLSEKEHPCQALADLMTIKERFGSLDGIRVAYVGDGNNVCNSLIVGCVRAGAEIRVATPSGYKPDAFALESGEESGKLSWTETPEEAVGGAQVVYTDTWVSMGEEKERAARVEAFKPYQVNAALMGHASKDAVFMHCLPAHRGDEVTDEVLDSEQSIVYDQAENRLHIQKAILLRLLEATQR